MADPISLTLLGIGIAIGLFGRFGDQSSESVVNNNFNANIDNKVVQKCKITTEASINNANIFIANSTLNGRINIGSTQIYKGDGCLINTYLDNSIKNVNYTDVQQAQSIKSDPFSFGIKVGDQSQRVTTNNKTNYTIKSLSYNKCELNNTASVNNVFLNINKSFINGSVNIYSSVQSSGSCKMTNVIKNFASNENINRISQTQTRAGWWSALIEGFIEILGKAIVPVIILGVLGIIAVIIIKSIETARDKKKQQTQQTQQKIIGLQNQIKKDKLGNFTAGNSGINADIVSSQPANNLSSTSKVGNFFSRIKQNVRNQTENSIQTTSDDAASQVKSSGLFGRLFKGAENIGKKEIPTLEKAASEA